ncbi:MAG: transposase [Promethearchaeota archaeon]
MFRGRGSWVEFHAAVDAETQVVLAGLVTHDGVGDARASPTLVERAVLERNIAEVLAGGAYDTRDDFNLLQGLGIEPRIEPRSNASTRSRGCPSRSRVVWEVRKVGLERWLASVDYSRRQAVERLYSRFKLVFGGRVHGRALEPAVVEVGHEVELLNHYARQLQLVKYYRGATLRRKGDDFYNDLSVGKKI